MTKPLPLSLPLTIYFLADSIIHSAQSLKGDMPQSPVLGLLLWSLYTWPLATLLTTMASQSTLHWRPLALLAQWSSWAPVLHSQCPLDLSTWICQQQLEFCVSKTVLPPNLVLPSLFTFLSLNTTIHPVFHSRRPQVVLEQGQQTQVPAGAPRWRSYFIYLRNKCIGLNVVSSTQFADVTPFKTQYWPRK